MIDLSALSIDDLDEALRAVDDRRRASLSQDVGVAERAAIEGERIRLTNEMRRRGL